MRNLLSFGSVRQAKVDTEIVLTGKTVPSEDDPGLPERLTANERFEANCGSDGGAVRLCPNQRQGDPVIRSTIISVQGQWSRGDQWLSPVANAVSEDRVEIAVIIVVRPGNARTSDVCIG